MGSIIKYKEIESKIILIRDQKVLIDKDVAEIYGVETKRINEAVKNNIDKFPKDYLFELSKKEFEDLRSNISTAKFAKTRVAPKAFTEKGLYMIATTSASSVSGDTIILQHAGFLNPFHNLSNLNFQL